MCLAVGVGLSLLARSRPKSIPAPDPSQVELTFEHEDTTYKLVAGSLYRAGPDPGRLTFVETLYDPDFFRKNYAVVEGKPHKKDPRTGALYPTRRRFMEGFEDAGGVRDLVSPGRGWTHFTLQSPLAPTVASYNDLRKRILRGEEDFLDNRVEIRPEVVHSGKDALRCYSVAPTQGMITAKASLSS